MNEAAAIATAVGARPDPDHEKRIAHGRSLDHKPSILQDLELGRPMEIDGIFDAPLEMARLAGVAAPTLEMVVALMKVRARAAGLYDGQTPATSEYEGITSWKCAISAGPGCGSRYSDSAAVRSAA